MAKPADKAKVKLKAPKNGKTNGVYLDKIKDKKDPTKLCVVLTDGLTPEPAWVGEEDIV